MSDDDSQGHKYGSTGVFKPGARISHYEVVRKIGSGGMGEVYMAKDTDLNRDVALKVLSLALCRDEGCRQQFRREAQAVARLNHPNIVQIYEVAEHDGLLFFAMEYVDGPDLLETCRLAEDRVQFVIDTGLQICDALRAAHNVGITHRDIKPSNILLGRDNRVRLADFGLAALEGPERLSQGESTLGTVGYMSPEQIRGEAIDDRSDIFSLGVMLYELLAGHRPFTGDYEAAVQYAIVNDPTPPLHEQCSNVPEALAGIIERALAKDPGQRHQTIVEMHMGLAELAGVQPGGTARTAGSFPVPIRRYLYWLMAAAVVVSLISYFLWDRESSPSEPVRMAVLPFQNIGPVNDNHYAAGMTDAITTNMAGLEGIQIISTRSAALFEDTSINRRTVGSELNVQYLLEGTVKSSRDTADGNVWVSVRLLKIDDDSYPWSKEYLATAAELLNVQSEIAAELARELNILVSGPQADRMTRIPTVSSEAWELYVRGNEYFHRTWSEEDIAIAIRMYQRAVALDSNFALAWAMLSRGHSSMYWEYFDRTDERCSMALRAAEHALELQPDLAEGHEALGHCYYHCYRRLDAALDEFEAGLMFQPSNSGLYTAIAAVQRRQGRLVEAVDNFKRALIFDPRAQQKAFDIALTYGMLRQYDSTYAYVDRTLTLAPDWTLPYLYRAWLPIIENGDTASAARALSDAQHRVEIYHSPFYWWLARLVNTDYEQQLSKTRPGSDTAAYYIHRARLYRLIGSNSAAMASADSARSILTGKLRDHPEDPLYLSQMGLAHAFLGNTEDAIELGNLAVDFLPASRDAFDAPFLLINFAEVLVMCGKYEDAVERLRHLLSIPGFASASYLELDPLWKPLRTRETFQALVASD